MSARPVPPSTTSTPFQVHSIRLAEVRIDKQSLAETMRLFVWYVMNKALGVNTPDDHLSAELDVGVSIDGEPINGYYLSDVTFTSLGHVRQLTLSNNRGPAAAAVDAMCAEEVLLVEAIFNEQTEATELVPRQWVALVSYDEGPDGMLPVFCGIEDAAIVALG